jgi:glycosyltransferase involved in cell wall biosynthesis
VEQRQRVFILAGLAGSLLNFRGPLLREMVARGHTVITAAPADDHTDEVVEALSKMGVRFVAVPMARGGLNPWQDLQSYRALVKSFRAFQPDVVFAYTAKPVIYGGMAARKVGGIRFYPMITGLGYAFTEGGGVKRKAVRALVQRLYRRGLAAANAVISQNPDDQGLFRALKLLPPNTSSVRVHGSGVDLAAFPPMPLPNSLVFLMLARLVADKGVCEYVAAAKQVKQSYPNAIFRLAGGLDPNPSSIKAAELQAWVDEGVIEYLGAVRPVQTALAACRFYVLPSYREGTPRSVLEALATGRPVITTDAPGCRETVVCGENGILVEPRNSDALAAAMIKLIEMPAPDIQRMADASLALARDKYDVHKVNAEILSVMGL